MLGALVAILAGTAAAYVPREAPKAPDIVLAATFDAALNAGRLDEALALLADDGTVKDPAGNAITGRDQIRMWCQDLIARHFHTDAGIRQLSDGGRVTWPASIADDSLRGLNAAPAAAFGEAIVVDGKIRSYTLRMMAGDRLKIQMARAKANEAVAREFIEAVRGLGELDAIDRLCASDFIDQDAAAGILPGPTELRRRVTAFRSACTGLVMSTEDIITAADRVVIRGTVAGTQTGPLPGLSSAGRSFQVGYIDILRIQDGRIAEHWGQIDLAAMRQQLAPTPTPSATLVAPMAPRPVVKPPEKNKSWFSWF